jgi:hypothetical protein
MKYSKTYVYGFEWDGGQLIEHRTEENFKWKKFDTKFIDLGSFKLHTK